MVRLQKQAQGAEEDQKVKWYWFYVGIYRKFWSKIGKFRKFKFSEVGTEQLVEDCSCYQALNFWEWSYVNGQWHLLFVKQVGSSSGLGTMTLFSFLLWYFSAQIALPLMTTTVQLFVLTVCYMISLVHDADSFSIFSLLGSIVMVYHMGFHTSWFRSLVWPCILANCWVWFSDARCAE